jgi:hypothetical protein
MYVAVSQVWDLDGASEPAQQHAFSIASTHNVGQGMNTSRVKILVRCSARIAGADDARLARMYRRLSNKSEAINVEEKGEAEE